MSEWVTQKISEVYEGLYDGPHATPPDSEDGAVFLGISNITPEGRLDFGDIKHISEHNLPKWTKRVEPRGGDIVFSYEATLNLYAIIPEGFWGCLGRRMALIRPNNSKAYGRFLYYYFFSPQWRSTVQENTVIGATVDRIPLVRFPDFPISIPDLQTQHRIADILSAYDALIENNQRQIKLLEEAAQRLYKEWFVDLRYPGHEDAPVVDGVPEGWIACVLDDVIEFNPKISLNKDRVKQCVPMAALSTQSMILNSGEFTETTSTSGSKFQNGDTLLARITPCLENGKTGFVAGLDSDEGAVGSTEFIVMRSKRLNPYMVYLLARTDDFRKTAINSMTGSDGRQRAQPGKIRAYPFLLPPDSIIDSFGDIVKPIFDTIQKRNQQNAQLSEARDRLLPKLMSGKIAV